MIYNLARHSQIETNDALGNVSLGVDALLPLIQTTTADDVVLYGDDILVLDCDLGAQVKIDEIRYYFDSTTDSGTVASTVGLYYKYDEADPYLSLQTFVGQDYYYSTITSGTGAPRYIRVVHTISGTAISGTVNGFEVTNDEDIVDFGPNGQRTAENFDVDLRYDPAIIREVEVYNDGAVTANVHIILEPQGTLVDNLLTISTSEDGPWVGPRQTNNELAGATTWDEGDISPTGFIAYDDTLRILPGRHTCQYTTKVFTTLDTQKFTMLNLDVSYPTRISGTIFEEDFSGGQVEAINVWQVEEGGASYSNFYMQHNDSVNVRVTTYDTFFYGNDWYMEFEFTNDASQDIGGGHTRVDPVYNAGSPGGISVIAGFYGTQVYVDGNTLGYINSSQSNAANPNRWISVKMRREFFILKVKAWFRDYDSEPVDWEIEHAFELDEVAEVARFSTFSPTNGQNARYDNILIVTNINTHTDTPGLVAVSGTDTRETVEIKSSNYSPQPFVMYRKFWNDSTANRIKWSDHLLYDNSYIYTYDTGLLQHGSSKPSDVRIHIDRSKNMSWNYVFAWPTNYTYPTMYIRRVDLDGNSLASLAYQSGGSGPASTPGYCFALKSDYALNIWIYLYVPTSTSELNLGEGYYLVKYDASLTQIAMLHEDSRWIYDMDIVYNTGELWYTNYETSAVIKLDVEGNIIASYTFTDEIRGIATDSDGGCWVIQLANLYHLDSNAELIEYFDYADVATSLSRVAVDGDAGLWLTDSFYVRYVNLEGEVVFSVEFEDQPVELKTYGTGVVAMLADRSWHFISKADQKVIKTIEDETGYLYQIGVDGGTFDNSLYAAFCPVTTDETWNLVPWKTVSVNDYTLPDQQYHQIRLTLRDFDDNYLSPSVNGLYLNESILKYNINPGNYTTIYMKADVEGQTETGNFESNLKAWWYIDN